MRIKGIAFVACVIVFEALAQGASITIDASCSTDLVGGGSIQTTFFTQTSVPAMGSCFAGLVPNPGPEAPFGSPRPNAAGRVIVDYGVSDGEFFAYGDILVVAMQPVFPADPPPGFQDSDTSAVASMTLDLIIWSAGPTRPGQIVWSGGGFAGGVGGHAEQGNFGCASIPEGQNDGVSCGGGLLPISLGESFPVHFDSRASAFVSWEGGFPDSAAGISFNVQFQLQELDGTPVDALLFPVPEPSTLVLLASALMALVLQGICRRKIVRSSTKE